jgi:Peptidase family M28
VLEGGGSFGYRFVFPAMRVGEHEISWHRPLAAFVPSGSDEPVLLHDAPTGYLTASPADRPDPSNPVPLWPRLLHREGHVTNLRLFAHVPDDPPHATLRNVRKLLDAREALGRPLPRSFARRLLTLPRRHTLDGWLASLPGRATDTETGRRLMAEVERCLEPASTAVRLPTSLTFGHTARRSFEVAYWETIATLSAGDYVHKNNADPSLDPVTRKVLPNEHRDLEALGDYLLGHHRRLIAEHGLTGKALAGELAFRWETDFDFPWMGGWLANQEGRTHERNLVVVIPGRDRSRAVLMADHYDTAYKWDRYEGKDGDGARVAAPGADDNASATAALMLASPVFLELSKTGKLGCDVWLVHLTGEEFPAEGLGARRLAQGLVEGGLELRLPDGGRRDLSGVRVKGGFVLDMVAHNGNRNRDVFQISPGVGPEALWLAYQAHLAAEAWNAGTEAWNRRPGRRGKGRGRRSRNTLPPTAEHLRLAGEVRPHDDPSSTLYNTDGQTLSDAGVPVVLFMEDYDIGRSGYHDSRDTLANINLDYGAALAAIAIEAVARAANEEAG